MKRENEKAKSKVTRRFVWLVMVHFIRVKNPKPSHGFSGLCHMQWRLMVPARIITGLRDPASTLQLQTESPESALAVATICLRAATPLVTRRF